ncbi:LysR family transcriptional regulator [Cognatiyoonia sp. IB215446]|uniref:LysR family transcriptional regulator n=1 Tax=Cognatiyoonia sp. IB215446 TaxID=3097355 RepID=UPI0039B775CA
MAAILDYQCVLAIRQEGNFARAAATIGISQPALTARIRRLEEELDVRLFERGRHGARLTAAGSAFSEAAERIVSIAEEAESAAKGAERGIGQSVRIGFTQISARTCLLPILHAFRDAHPLVRVQLRETTTVRLEALVAEDRLDVALLHPPVHRDGLAELHLRSCPILQVENDDASDEGRPLVEYPRSDAPVLISEYNRRYPGAQLAPPAAEADTAFGALLLSEAGYGPCVVAEDSWRQVESSNGRFARTLDMEIHTSLVWRNMDRREIVRNLIAVCKRIRRQI